MDDEEDEMWSKVFQVVEWSGNHNIQFEGCHQDLVAKAKETVDNYVGLRMENKKLKEELAYLKVKLAGERRRSSVGVSGPATKRKSCQGDSPPKRKRKVSMGAAPDSISEDQEDDGLENLGSTEAVWNIQGEGPFCVNEVVGKGVSSEGGDADERGSSVEATAGSETEIPGEPFTLKRRILQAFDDDVAFQEEIAKSSVLLTTCHDDEMPKLSPEYGLPEAAVEEQSGEEQEVQVHDETLVGDHSDSDDINLDLQSVSVREEDREDDDVSMSILDQAKENPKSREKVHLDGHEGDDDDRDLQSVSGSEVERENGRSDTVKDGEIQTVGVGDSIMDVQVSENTQLFVIADSGCFGKARDILKLRPHTQINDDVAVAVAFQLLRKRFESRPDDAHLHRVLPSFVVNEIGKGSFRGNASVLPKGFELPVEEFKARGTFYLISFAPSTEHSWLTVINFSNRTIQTYDSLTNKIATNEVLKNLKKVRSSYKVALKEALYQKYGVEVSGWTEKECKSQPQGLNDCVVISLKNMETLINEEDPMTFVNPRRGNWYRREFVKLLLNTTEVGQRLLKRFDKDLGGLWTALEVIDGEAKPSNEELDMNKTVQMIGETTTEDIGSEFTVEPEATSVAATKTVTTTATETEATNSGKRKSNAVTLTEPENKVPEKRSDQKLKKAEQIESQQLPGRCDGADEVRKVTSGKPMVTHKDRPVPALDALIEDLQRTLRERDKENERLRKELELHVNRKVEDRCGVQHLTGGCATVQNSSSSGANTHKDNTSAVGLGKLPPVLDEGEGAGADQNEELGKEAQVRDVERLSDTVREKEYAGLLSSVTQKGTEWRAVDRHKRSLLHVAAEVGPLEFLKFILDLGGLDINGRNGDGDTPLHCAVSQGCREGVLEKCKLLIEYGADVYMKNYKEAAIFLHNYIVFFQKGFMVGPTPTEFSSITAFLVKTGHSKIFRVAEDKNGNTPLHLAVRWLEPKTLRLLHLNGVNFNTVNKKGENILAFAIFAKRSPQFLKTLVTQFSVDSTKVDSEGNSLLHLLASRYSLDVLKFFLDLRLTGLDVNGQDRVGNTPLHCLLLNSEIEVADKCKLLVSYGANVNSLNNRKMTPLHCAVHVNDTDIALETIKCLIEHGADPFAKDGHYEGTFLHRYIVERSRFSTLSRRYYAAKTKKNREPAELHALVEFLFNKRYSIIFNSPCGHVRFKKTPLHLIVEHLEPEERTFLLLKDAGNVNFNVVDQHGKSVLQYAIIKRRSTKFLASLITQLGADTKHVDLNEQSALHTAAESGTADALKLLLEYDLDVNKRSKFGCTPLHLAVHPGECETIDVVRNHLVVLPTIRFNKIDVFEKCKLLISKGADINITDRCGRTPLSITMSFYKGADKDKLVNLFRLRNG